MGPSSNVAIKNNFSPAPQLEAVYRKHHAFVWRSLLRLGVPMHAVDDAVHDTFLVVARRLHEFEGRSSPKTWLFAIAYRIAQSLRRDRAREARMSAAFEDYRRVSAAPARVPGQHEAALELHQLLAELDAEKRAVFILAELEGMTAPEIAASMKLKVPTVYSRLRLARAQLEKAVAQEIGNDR